MKARHSVKRELLDTFKARKLAYYGHTMRKQGNCLEKEITQGTMPRVRRRGRPRTAWIDNIKTWTGLPVEKSIRMRQDIEINGESTSMVWPTLGSRTAKEQKRTEQNRSGAERWLSVMAESTAMVATGHSGCALIYRIALPTHCSL